MGPSRLHRYSNEIVAMVCHDATIAMQKAHELMRLEGTDAVPTGPFMYLHPDLLAAAVDGVQRARRIGSRLSARDHHNAWVVFLAARGWRRGEKNPEEKTHPNLVDWDDMAPEQQDKDRVFMGIVISMTIEV